MSLSSMHFTQLHCWMLQYNMEDHPSVDSWGMLTHGLSPPKGKLVNCDFKEIDDVCGIFFQGAKEVLVPEA